MPSSSKRVANCAANTASYSMIGTIGCSPGLMSNPASVILLRKYVVLRSSLSINAVHHTAVLVGAPARFAHKAGGMAFINHNNGIVLIRQVADHIQLGNGAI